MRTRKRAKYTWLPILGSRFDQEGFPSFAGNTIFLEIDTPIHDADPPTEGAGSNNGLTFTPIVPDFTIQPDAGDVTNTLRDYVEGQDWLLKRIVGKCHVHGVGSSTAGAVPSALVTAGFFVARALDADPAQVDLEDDEYNPSARENAQNPWIWRRSWMIGNLAQPAAVNSANGLWLQNNGGRSSIQDGPHIDSKVSRRIRREQRLWFAASAFGVDTAALSWTASFGIRIALEVRVLGAMRRGKNVSAF